MSDDGGAIVRGSSYWRIKLVVLLAGVFIGVWQYRANRPVAISDVPSNKPADSSQGVSPQAQPSDESSDSTDQQARIDAANLALHPQLKDLKYDATIREIAKREDPVVDGWDTERFSELAGKQLKLVGKLLGDVAQIDEAHCGQVSASDFRGELRPAKRKLAYSDDHWRVYRKSLADSVSTASKTQRDFQSSILPLAKLFQGATDRRFKFKIIRVDLDADQARTVCYFQMIGTGPKSWQLGEDGEVRRVQVNATWDCTWDVTDREHPTLKTVAVSDYEEVHSEKPSLFSDCTASQFQGIAALHDQLIYGRDHWYANLESSIGVEGRGNGMAIGDANGDGLEDLYVCQPAALPNKLFLRNPDGTFRDASAFSGVDWLDSSRGALFVDLDNDGDQDLVVSLSSEILLHENDGQGSYQVRQTIQTNSRLFSLNAMDFDNDGQLDLYACGYSGANQIRPEDIFASPVPYHDANNGAENLLFRQRAPWQFADVTASVGLRQNNLRFSLASAWADMDLDGDLDLYVANDFGRNSLYRNDAGKFVDVAAEAGVEDIGPGMSCHWGDYDNDGWPDLYVSNMFSSAGSRITHTSLFKPDASQTDLEGFRRHARGNTLFRNRRDGTFADEAISSGTSMGRWAWGSQLVDMNNDGWRDVYVTNGFVTADSNNDL